ncbi:hypothetical protein E3N88_14290 [Mikania micrantha]|uniref:Uncharacterized protein n=1 Tax=Mikania micrantha TaxID=192012 RepID=A0A5N6P0Z7_9ASTR|nr:hypothetical protein E3N88_14290 [Mikania micrantha]
MSNLSLMDYFHHQKPGCSLDLMDSPNFLLGWYSGLLHSTQFAWIELGWSLLTVGYQQIQAVEHRATGEGGSLDRRNTRGDRSGQVSNSLDRRNSGGRLCEIFLGFSAAKRKLIEYAVWS